MLCAFVPAVVLTHVVGTLFFFDVVQVRSRVARRSVEAYMLDLPVVFLLLLLG
jgi:hypothetical protein